MTMSSDSDPSPWQLRHRPSQIGFVDKYERALESVASALRRWNPDFVLTLTRKGPRLLELMQTTGIWDATTPVLTEKALDFVKAEDLAGANVVVFDDIIVSGTSIKHVVKRLKDEYNARLKVVTLGIDKEKIAVGRDNIAGVPFEYHLELNSSKRFSFSKELVHAFIPLNKPYDVDHCVFYSHAQHDVFSKIDNINDITTTPESKRDYARYSYIPDAEERNAFIDSIFATGIDINVQINKIRLYFDEFTGECALVPIVVLSLSEKAINQAVVFNEEQLSYCNVLVEDALDRVSDNEYVDREIAVYRVVWYIVSYLYGVYFYNEHGEGFAGLTLPSRSVHEEDLFYLFGIDFGQAIVDRFDEAYEDTVEWFEDVTAAGAKAESDVLSASNLSDEDLLTPSKDIDQWLDDGVTDHIAENINSDDRLGDRVATVFEALYIEKEIEKQNELRTSGDEVKEEAHERLDKGLNFYQIMELLAEAGGLPLEVDGRNELIEAIEDDIEYSLAIDFLVDAGIQIPLFYKAEFQEGSESTGGPEQNVLQRVYRNGEDALSAPKNSFSFLVSKTIEGLFNHMNQSEASEELKIAKVPFEKFGALMIDELIEKQDAGDIDFQESDNRGSTLEATLNYNRHGKVVNVKDRSVIEPESSKKMFYEWCQKEEIIKTDDYDENIIFADELNDSSQSDPTNGVITNERNPLDQETVSYYRTLWRLMYHFVIIANEEDYLNKHDLITAVTTCGDPYDFVNAVRVQLELLFERENYRLNKAIEAAEYCVDSFDGELEKEPINEAYEETAGPVEPANSIDNKWYLWRNLKEKILPDINNYFEEVGGQLQDNYYTHLYGDHISDIEENPRVSGLDLSENDSESDTAKPTQVESETEGDPRRIRQAIEINRLRVFGNLCLHLTEALRSGMDASRKVRTSNTKTDGSWYKTSRQAIKKALRNVESHIENWNKTIEDYSELQYGPYRVDELPKQSDNEYNVHDFRRIRKGAYDLLAELIPFVREAHDKLEQMYHKTYSNEPWNKTMLELFPKRAGSRIVEFTDTDFSWVLWFDIKGWRDMERGGKIVSRLNERFDEFHSLEDDGAFEKNGDDQWFILLENEENIVKNLRRAMSWTAQLGIHVRVSVCSTKDNDDIVKLHTGYGYYHSSDTHVLAIELGQWLEEEENEECHSLVVSEEVEQIGVINPDEIAKKAEVLRDFRDEVNLYGHHYHAPVRVAEFNYERMVTLDDF